MPEGSQDRNVNEYSLLFKHETDSGYLVMDGTVQCWLPKSRVERPAPLLIAGEIYEFEIPDWLAADKGLV